MISFASPPVYHARAFKNVFDNLAETCCLAQRADVLKAATAIFPELGLSAYAIEDLLFQDALLDAVERAIDQLVDRSRQLFPALIVGAPLRHQGGLFMRLRSNQNNGLPI